LNHAENLELIKLFEGLRVADVRDGMDWVGYHHYGSTDPSIRPLWRTTALGIAKTARYVPYEGPTPRFTPEEYSEWVPKYYAEILPDPWSKELQPGDFMCLDVGGVDVGLIGSNNSLDQRKKGCVGYLTNGAARDTDEMILNKIPMWSKFISQNMSQARLRWLENNIPVCIGGVAIYPGDVVLADGDGAIIVPRKIARDVAKWARREWGNDQASRKKHYIDLDMELDDTVKNH